MTFNEIYKQFIRPTKENFPVKCCTEQNKREPEVYDSTSAFICLVIDKRFDNYWNLAILYPYICKEDNDKISYGWVNRNGEIFCNIENSTQLWDEFVIGFRKYNEDSYDELWNSFIKEIEEQYDD